MQELLFLYMTNCLNVLYKCMKFRRNIFDGYQVKEQTRLCDGQTHKQVKGLIHPRVMVLVHDMSSECALQKYEVLLKYL